MFFTFNVKSLCSQDCPLECDSIKYNSFKSYAKYPSAAYASVLSKNSNIRAKYDNSNTLNQTVLKQNMLELNVFYDKMDYYVFEEVANMKLTDLLSTIGGTLGLFLGISVLSLFEIIDIVLQILLYKRRNRLDVTKTKEKIEEPIFQIRI